MNIAKRHLEALCEISSGLSSLALCQMAISGSAFTRLPVPGLDPPALCVWPYSDEYWGPGEQIRDDVGRYTRHNSRDKAVWCSLGKFGEVGSS